MAKTPPKPREEAPTPEPMQKKVEITKEEHARLQELVNGVKFAEGQIKQLTDQVNYNRGRLDIYVELLFSKYHLKKEGTFEPRVDGDKFFLVMK